MIKKKILPKIKLKQLLQFKRIKNQIRKRIKKTGQKVRVKIKRNLNRKMLTRK